ncbi:putative small G-protein Ras2 [Xylariaceae sp. FL1272]|nr:putative small G-protein Ras2 [Xylariaceae sp. FL1272]
MQTEAPTYRIGVFGSDTVGKSSMTTRLRFGIFDDQYNPTPEAWINTINTIIDNKQYKLEILDTPSWDTYHDSWDHVIEQCDGFVLVYSVASQPSFGSVTNLYEQMLRVKRWDAGGRLPIMIAANKCEEESQQEDPLGERRREIRAWGSQFIHTSAKKNVNVTKAFYDIVKILLALAPKALSDTASSNGSTWKPSKDQRGGCFCTFM